MTTRTPKSAPPRPPHRATDPEPAATFAQEVLAGLEDYRKRKEAGNRLTFRRVSGEHVPDPSDYAPGDVRRVREAVAVSQRVFARLLGASPATVAAWERGGKRPAPMARRLLDEVGRDPQRWRDMASAV